MNPTHIEHIGFAVKNLEESIRYWETVFGLKCYRVEEVTDQKVRTAFFQVGATKIELLESTDPGGPVGKFIEKRGEGMHHIAFAVDDVKAALAHATENNIALIDKVPRAGAEGLQIAFLDPRATYGVLTELCAKSEPGK